MSIIVPVRNEEGSVSRVVEQLLAQEHSPHELVVADGGSTDRTREIVREFIVGGHPVRLIEDNDAYPGRARNLAIAAATNDWVAMTDAGTIVPPGWLFNLVRKVAENPAADVVYGTYEPILDSFFRECLALTFVPPAELVDGEPWRGPSTASMMIRKTVWESVGRFPEHLRACEDLRFFERITAADVPFVRAPKAKVQWNIPAGFLAAFRRFRTYSRHTLIARMGRSWQLAVGRMYLAGAAVAVLAALHHWAWLGLLVLAAGGRVYRTVSRRRPWLPLRYRVGPHTYLVVGILLLWLDLAAFAGCVDFVVRRRTSRPTNDAEQTADIAEQGLPASVARADS